MTDRSDAAKERALSSYELGRDLLREFSRMGPVLIGMFLAVVGAVAAALALALDVPALWTVAGGAALAGLANGFIARRTSLAVVPRLLAINAVPLATSHEERAAVADLPPRYLDPSSVSTPEQLEQLFIPTRDRARDAYRESPQPSLALLLSSVSAVAGVIAAVLIPAIDFVAVGDIGLSPWVLVTMCAGAPLAALYLYNHALLGGLRAANAQLVLLAQPELARLWAADPGYSAGKVVVSAGDTYVINESALPTRERAPRMNRALTIALVVALGVLVGLVLLLAVLNAVTQSFLLGMG